MPMSTAMLVTFCLNICLFSEAFPLIPDIFINLLSFPPPSPTRGVFLQKYWRTINTFDGSYCILLKWDFQTAQMLLWFVSMYAIIDSLPSLLGINAHLFYRFPTAFSCVITNTLKITSLCLLTLYKLNSLPYIYNEVHTIVTAWDVSIINSAKQWEHCSSCNISSVITTTTWSKKFGVLGKK